MLGVDFGSVRIGLAAGDTLAKVASPRPMVASVEGLSKNVQTLIEAAKKEAAKAIVIGLPLGPEGEETPMSRVCRKLADLVRQEGWTVFEVDETLTSATAAERLLEHEVTAAKRARRLDSEAACLILERFFEEHGQKEG